MSAGSGEATKPVGKPGKVASIDAAALALAQAKQRLTEAKQEEDFRLRAYHDAMSAYDWARRSIGDRLGDVDEAQEAWAALFHLSPAQMFAMEYLSKGHDVPADSRIIAKNTAAVLARYGYIDSVDLQSSANSETETPHWYLTQPGKRRLAREKA